jgi:hypothetical protein
MGSPMPIASKIFDGMTVANVGAFFR